jgi:4-hydroxy-3-methylbut-2-enyl diphosphate reductase
MSTNHKKLYLCNPRGFCAGVVRAIQTVEKALELFGPPIYVKHQIVHNRHVVDDLAKKGAIFIEDLEKVPKGARLIYSAHGTSPQVREVAKRRGLIEIDATCVLVTRLHSALKWFAKKGHLILLIGHKKHVEIQGIAGESPAVTTIIESTEDVKNLPFPSEQKLFYLTQTTFGLDDVQEITSALRAKYPSIETLPSASICYATTNRQLALRAIIPLVDLVFVIGDPASSNSNRLAEVARKRSIPAHLINNPSEIEPHWLKNVQAIGLTAGASTPESVVKGCINRLETLGVSEKEEMYYPTEETVFALPKLDFVH